MLDGEIRVEVDRHLRGLHAEDASTVYRHELGLCLGETRVDVAAINGKITGCEIKGSSDTLARLPKQIELYDRVVDESILVTESRHAAKATALLPLHWGIWLISESASGVELIQERAPSPSPHLDAHSIAQLVWRDEGMAVLRGRELHRGMSRATRFQVWDALVEGIPDLDELRAVVRQVLKERQSWPGG